MIHSYKRYLLFFTVAYIGFTVLFAVLNQFLSSASTTGSILVPFVSAMLTGNNFLKHEKRMPTDDERSKLTWGSFSIFVGLNLSLFLVILALGGFSDFSTEGGMGVVMAIAAGLFFLIGVIAFFMMRWAYGGLLRKQAEKMREKEADTFD